MSNDNDWPYTDLKLCTPHCPMCGTAATIMVGTMLHPLAWCPNDECEAMTWDPSIPAAQLLANQQEVQVTTTPLADTP